MKQKFLYILAAAVAALTLAACDKNDFGPDSGNVAPIFTATIEGGQSRASGSDWEPGDKIGITCTGATNVCHITSEGDGLFVVEDPAKKIFYKSSSTGTSSWTFRAYYPWSGTTVPTISTSDQTKQKSFDFLYAIATGTKDSPAVKFVFSHIMSKVTFVFIDGKNFNVSDIKSYSLGDLFLNGKLNNTSVTGDWTCSATTTVKATSVEVDFEKLEKVVVTGVPVTPLILLPQTLPGETELKIVSRDGRTYSVGLTFPDKKLVAGNNYKFTVRVSKTGLTVGNCTIEDWSDYSWPEGGGQGSASSADDPDE